MLYCQKSQFNERLFTSLLTLIAAKTSLLEGPLLLRLSRRLPSDLPATATVSSMGRHLLTLNNSGTAFLGVGNSDSRPKAELEAQQLIKDDTVAA